MVDSLVMHSELRQCPLCTLSREQEAASLSEIRPVSSLRGALTATPRPHDPRCLLPGTHGIHAVSRGQACQLAHGEHTTPRLITPQINDTRVQDENNAVLPGAGG